MYIVGDYPYDPKMWQGWWGVIPPEQRNVSITVTDSTTTQVVDTLTQVVDALKGLLNSPDATVQQKLDAARLILESTKE